MTLDVITWNDTLVNDILNISNPKNHGSPKLFLEGLQSSHHACIENIVIAKVLKYSFPCGHQPKKRFPQRRNNNFQTNTIFKYWFSPPTLNFKICKSNEVFFKAHFETYFLKLYSKRTQIHGKTNTSKMMMITKWTEDE
jgi:hypothetical protein